LKKFLKPITNPILLPTKVLKQLGLDGSTIGSFAKPNFSPGRTSNFEQQRLTSSNQFNHHQYRADGILISQLHQYSVVSSYHMSEISKYLSLLFVTTIFISCSEQKYYVNIPSKYSGWVYLISSNDKFNKNNESLIDSNGIAYIPQNCNGDKVISVKVDGKEISPMRLKSYEQFEANDSYRVTYSRFYFPLKTNYDPNNVFDTLLIFEGHEITKFQYLVKQNKINIKRFKSCQ